MDFLKHVFGPDFTPELYRMLLFGLAMVVVMLWKPRGFVGSREPTAFLKERKIGLRKPSPRRATADERRQRHDKPILKVEHLSMKFGGLMAIGDLSFEAKRGEITALIGPNGAGKTTVFNCITGFYKPTEGMITLTSRDGNEVPARAAAGLPNHRQAKVARTFQNIRLFSGMTVLENLLVAQHNKLMKASGYTILGLFGFSGYRRASRPRSSLPGIGWRRPT